jgi:hypothetical protein
MPKSLEDLENEVRLLKGEVQQALLDIRDFLLTYVENPFLAGGTRERPTPAPRTSKEGPSPGEGPQEGVVARVRGDEGPGEVVRGGPGGAPAPPGPPGAPAASPPVHGYTASFSQPVSQPGMPPQQSGAPGTPPQGPPLGLEGREVPPPAPPAAKGDTAPQAPSPKGGEPLGRPAAPSPRGEEPPRPSGEGGGGGSAFDLTTLALLAPWVERGLRTVGKEALEKVLNLYAALGGMPPTVHRAALALLELAPEAEEGSPPCPSLRQCLRLLADLDGLLQRARRNRQGTLLLEGFLEGVDGAGPSP